MIIEVSLCNDLQLLKNTVKKKKDVLDYNSVINNAWTIHTLLLSP